MHFVVPCRHLDTMEYKSVIVDANSRTQAYTMALLTHKNIALVGRALPIEWPKQKH